MRPLCRHRSRGPFLAHLLLPLLLFAPPARPGAALDEVRGLWVVRTDITRPAAVSRMVQLARENGLNTLFVQCRGRGDACYLNALEPRAQALAGAPAEFDPLASAVAKGHAAGLQVHAWVNACYVWSDRRPPESPAHLLNAHPEWLAVRKSGARCRAGEPEVFICPGHPEARRHLAAVCGDLARRYELDGLQLDYIRYAGAEFCFCGGCLERFRLQLPETAAVKRAAARGARTLPAAFPAEWRSFRRRQVTELLREIRSAVLEARPSRKPLTLSAAVIPWGAFPGDFRRTEAYNVVGQDWYGWIREGLVDAVCPMTYQPGHEGFRGWVRGVLRDHPQFPVWFGIGAYLFGPESAAAKVRTVRSSGGQGWVLFSYTAVTRKGTDDTYLRSLRSRVLPGLRAAR